VVNVASIDGIQPGQMRVVYGMTKAAVINMTKGFAKEYGNQGIRVNALLPGFTVGAVLYMVSDEASYFTGQGMVVDGGAII